MSEEEFMLRSVVRRPSPATIIALLVLVIVAAPLADAAQKAVSSPKAQSAAEKKKSTKAVEKAKYADNAGKIRGYSVGFAALPNRVVLTDGRGKLPAAIIPAEAQGPKGDPGPQGIQGPKGAGFGQVRLVPATGAASINGVADATAVCAADEKVVGGGHEIVVPPRVDNSDRSVVEIRQSKPIVVDQSAGTSGWYVQVQRIPPEVTFDAGGVAHPNTTPPTAQLLAQVKAWAVCAK
jgi:hypothetical protein